MSFSGIFNVVRGQVANCVEIGREPQSEEIWYYESLEDLGADPPGPNRPACKQLSKYIRIA